MSNKDKAVNMKKDDKPLLVPKLRFPEFRGKGEWETKPLSTFVRSLDAGVSVNSGDRPAAEGEFGVLKTSCVTNGVFEPNENKVVFSDLEQERLAEPVGENTIIISRMNTPVLVGANAYIEASAKNLFLPDRLWAAKPREGVSIRFLAFVLGSAEGRSALSNLAKGSSGSMKNITKPDVLALPIVAPTQPEQQKIAECLSSVDEVIAAQARKLDALKTHKKGLMQQLFPREGETQPRLRFPEFRGKGEWKAVAIAEVCDLIVDCVNKTAPLVDELTQYKMLRTTNVKGGRIDREDCRRVSKDTFVKWTRRADVRRGDVILTREAPIGEVGYVDFNDTVFLGQRLMQYRTNPMLLEPRFLLYSFLSNNLQNQFGAHEGSGSTVSHIRVGDCSKFELSLPLLPEQHHIATCLSTLDTLITAETQKLETLKTHKRGLMQQLFPAREEVQA